jgi:hypothetical protein
VRIVRIVHDPPAPHEAAVNRSGAARRDSQRFPLNAPRSQPAAFLAASRASPPSPNPIAQGKRSAALGNGPPTSPKAQRAETSADLNRPKSPKTPTGRNLLFLSPCVHAWERRAPVSPLPFPCRSLKGTTAQGTVFAQQSFHECRRPSCQPARNASEGGRMSCPRLRFRLAWRTVRTHPCATNIPG